MDFNIKHDEKYKKFYISIAGKECCLKYETIDNKVLDFKIMFVPRNMRGMGLAKKVIEYALKVARGNNMKVRASCSYVQQYFANHPEYFDLVYNRKTEFNWILSNN